MKVYTKTGDKGFTSLIGGERVPKSDLRVEAYGTVDELTAFTALLGDRMRSEERLCDLTPRLEAINCRLMTVAALLAVGHGGEGKMAPLEAEHVAHLEEEIDQMQASVPAITKFTIPGGHVLLSLCHVCRTVCRRAERAALRASAEHEIEPTALQYLNRLSDWFYLLGRVVTERLGIEETLWRP
jgi:cob(I)alamin adenosyltransferase